MFLYIFLLILPKPLESNLVLTSSNNPAYPLFNLSIPGCNFLGTILFKPFPNLEKPLSINFPPIVSVILSANVEV